MTSLSKYIIEPKNKIEDNGKEVPIYEHAGLHMVLKKIIGNDQLLLKNGESKCLFIINCIF